MSALFDALAAIFELIVKKIVDSAILFYRLMVSIFNFIYEIIFYAIKKFQSGIYFLDYIFILFLLASSPIIFIFSVRIIDVGIYIYVLLLLFFIVLSLSCIAAVVFVLQGKSSLLTIEKKAISNKLDKFISLFSWGQSLLTFAALFYLCLHLANNGVFPAPTRFSVAGLEWDLSTPALSEPSSASAARQSAGDTPRPENDRSDDAAAPSNQREDCASSNNASIRSDCEAIITDYQNLRKEASSKGRTVPWDGSQPLCSDWKEYTQVLPRDIGTKYANLCKAWLGSR